MSALFLTPDEVARRRAALVGADAPLAALAASLARDLAPVVARPVWLPPNKARMTRRGGTCPRDGARLEFDPYAPRAHRCPACGAVYDRDEDYEWWTFGYQLWLAERAVQAASLALIASRDGAPATDPTQRDVATFAAHVLDAQADAYLGYANVDNVLGPTRPFFSTYLESLWLVHVCTALDLLGAAQPGAHDALVGRVCARVVEPSRALIASFPEGRSNRQVWHAVARLAAACVLGNAPAARDAVHGPEGIAKLLATALLDDGSWYEGENYHQFAHRGFWYAFRMAERGGIELAPPLVARFRRGYGVPFRVALPDWTLPARRDSQYAVSLRQWRWAEWCELGIADDAGRSLRRALADLYAVGDPPLPHGTGRWRATGESERNEPASALSRADLGWKSLLFARPELATADPSTDQRSELLAAQGYAILRRDAGRIYAALDFGGGGGGHGHPDRLNVILQDGDARWLDDPGTGTYVERTLHWYRSTLAHAAPLVDGRSQPRGAGALLAFDPGRDGPDAIETKLPRSASVAATTALGDVRFARALVATDAYVVDQLTWEADRIATVDLPFPVDGTLDGVARWTPFEPGGAGGLEDGFDFLHDAEAVAAGADRCRISLDARGATGARASLWLASPGATLWRAVGPGPPGVGQRRFHAVRMQGSRGVVTAVWDLRGTVAGVHADAGVVTVTLANGTVDRHVVVSALDADRVRGEASDDDATSDARPSAPVDLAARLSATWTTFEIGAGQYLRSESSWEDAGAPAATVRLRVVGDRLELDLDVRLGRPPAFAPTGAFNPLDNERADVNSDGLQLLIAPATAPEHLASWLLVPERPAPTVRITPTSPADGSARALTASWRERDDGWTIRCAYPLGDLAGTVVALDLAVNEQPPGRERRRGQLVLGRPDGAFVYLRGDRMSAARALRFRLPPPEPVA